jgi:hypothetical protein
MYLCDGTFYYTRVLASTTLILEFKIELRFIATEDTGSVLRNPSPPHCQGYDLSWPAARIHCSSSRNILPLPPAPPPPILKTESHCAKSINIWREVGISPPLI